MTCDADEYECDCPTDDELDDWHRQQAALRWLADRSLIHTQRYG